MKKSTRTNGYSLIRYDDWMLYAVKGSEKVVCTFSTIPIRTALESMAKIMKPHTPTALPGGYYFEIVTGGPSGKVAKICALTEGPEVPTWVKLKDKKPTETNDLHVRIWLFDGSELNVLSQNDGDFFWEYGDTFIHAESVNMWRPINCSYYQNKHAAKEKNS